jgi:branched-chain amino acid transport system permease protein
MTSEILQYAFNGIAAGAIYALVGSGFMLIYSTSRFFHFAHGVIYTTSAYITYGAVKFLGLSMVSAVLAALIAAALLGFLMEIGIYYPLKKARAGALVLLLASLGLLVVLQTLISVIFGAQTVALRGAEVSNAVSIMGARSTLIQIITVLTSLLVCSLVWAILHFTILGRLVRATANDPELAMITGVPTERILRLTFVIGSLMAGIAGVLVAYDTYLTPTMGFGALLMGMIAFLIGGGDSVPSVWLGGAFLGLAYQFGAWILPSKWQDTVVFVILLLVLLLRPQGVLGKPLRKATV